MLGKETLLDGGEKVEGTSSGERKREVSGDGTSTAAIGRRGE